MQAIPNPHTTASRVNTLQQSASKTAESNVQQHDHNIKERQLR